jgi:integral membrane sensor domain MASE1
MLSTFMAAFILYNFHAYWLWWIGLILITLAEVIFELNVIENNRIKNKAIMDSIIGKGKKK